MPIEERPSLLRSSTTVIIGAAIVVVGMIHQAGIAVAVTIISYARVAVGLAIGIDSHHNIGNALALPTPACVHINVVQLVSCTTLAISDRMIISRLVQPLNEFNSGIEQ